MTRRPGARGVALAAACVTAMLGLSGTAAMAGPEAVGRLNYAGYKARQHCTGFLTDAGHLVTAAHCVGVPADAEIHFLLGYDRGRWVGHIALNRARFRRLEARDTAVACGVASAGSPGLRLVDARTRPGERLYVWGYGVPRRHVRQESACTLTGQDKAAGALRLDCQVSSGASGGPVVRRLPDGTYDAVGLVSRSGRGGSLAASLTRARLAQLCGAG